MIYLVKSVAFLICIAVFMYMVVDNYFYFKNKAKEKQ